MDITGREPQLGGQPEDNSPMLGGDRRVGGPVIDYAFLYQMSSPADWVDYFPQTDHMDAMRWMLRRLRDYRTSAVHFSDGPRV